jgi:5-methylcytosine-specific restriction protein A
MGMIEPATLVDHIQPHQGDASLFWDKANWQPSCSWHHNSVKKQLEELYKRGRCSAGALRLTSSLALELAKRAPKVSTVDDDGWPTS